jgi:DNA-binding transcriptional MerR regulator
LNVPETNTTATIETSPREYKASDLLKLAGLTYRQLHDWENRAGAMAPQRATDAGWRKFTAEEVLALCVCASLRRQFSLPLEKVGGLFAWLLNAPSDSVDAFFAERGRLSLAMMKGKVEPLLSLKGEHWKEAVADEATRFFLTEYVQATLDSLRDCPIRYAYRAARFGHTVYLYTDLAKSLILFEENMANAIVERYATGPFIVCPLNAMFNETHSALGKPVLTDGAVKPLAAKWQELQSRIRLADDECEVVRLIRDKVYQRVTLHLTDGRIVRADVEEDLTKSGAAKRDGEILRAIKDKDFATVTVQRTDGQIVRLVRKSTVKFDRVTGKT